MRKILLLLLALLTLGASGAWADVTKTVMVSLNPATNGDFSIDAVISGYYTKWTSNALSGLAGVEITTGGNLSMKEYDVNGNNVLAFKTTSFSSTFAAAEAVTFAAPSGYFITGYSMKVNQVATGDAYRVYMSNGGYYSLYNSTSTKSISETLPSVPSVTIKISDYLGTGKSSANPLCVTSLTIDLKPIIPVSVDDTNGAFTRSDNSGSSTWCDTWTANNTIPAAEGMTLRISYAGNSTYDYDMQYQNSTFKIATGGGNGVTNNLNNSTVYTITAPNGYLIDSYKLVGTASASSVAKCEFFRANESLTGTYITSSSTEMSVTDVCSSTASFTLQGFNQAITLSSFVINIVAITDEVATDALTKQISKAETIITALDRAPYIYSITGDLSSQKTSAQSVLNDGAKTATEIAEASTSLYNIMKTLILNSPTSGFYRMKGNYWGRYVKSVDALSTMATSSGTDNNTSIYYITCTDETNHYYKLLSYDKGEYIVGQEMGDIGDYGILRIRPCAYPVADCFNIYTNSTSITSGSSYTNPSGRSWQVTSEATLQSTTDFPSATQYNIKFERINTLPVTITAAKWATLSAPVALKIPTGVTAYYISALSATEATLATIPTTTIPANTPVILYANVDVDTSFDFDIVDDISPIEGNQLTKTIAAISVDDGVAYTLQQNAEDESIVGLFPKSEGTIKGFKAYLEASKLDFGGGVKGFTFKFSDTDGVSSVAANTIKADNAIYNLAGQRIENPTRGIYIMNGKKVIIK